MNRHAVDPGRRLSARRKRNHESLIAIVAKAGKLILYTAFYAVIGDLLMIREVENA
jgi:hypothetical protein